MKTSSFGLLITAILLTGCMTSTWTYQETDPVFQPRMELTGPNCADWAEYIPDTANPELQAFRRIRVNFHVMRNDEGTNNFPDSAHAVRYIHNLLDDANKKLRNNTQMHLPLGNNTQVRPIHYQYVLTPSRDKPENGGIYFHNDSEYAYFNKRGGKGTQYLYNREVYDKYGIQKGEVINVFLVEHPEDSIGSPTYGATTNGVGFTGFVKMAGLHTVLTDTLYYNGQPNIRGFWFCSGLLNHEIGHSLGLGHTWSGNDGCDDTPTHPNCWGSANFGPCKDGWSNNMMDYNNYQNAMTPCQIGRVHQLLTTPGDPRRAKLVPDHCEYKPELSIHIPRGDSVVWNGYRDVLGDLVLGSGSRLVIRCDIHMTTDSRIKVRPGAKLYLIGARVHNECEGAWNGIELMEKKGVKGEVVFMNGARLEQVKLNIEPTE